MSANEKTEAEKVPVLCRFSREELDWLRAKTGADADATAVACYVRATKSREEEA